ncbi:MAG: hypothetical protein LKG20_04735 [Tetrasphaera jenkinsii]|jgi:hypothetical protein|uniref:Uncharacterized protein n=1 Tax=Nostocoides jenkinsii Ben 74 TaxID=1193518 RepID=A0A077MEU2_9MICO|nr:hypothetical protein [Tetrasphaera jenkinsii]MCI1261577.1 hypothetical protein [Tetrasphaera jenkinsii]CCI53543.1 hypothetical protein BN13_410019 [Tetrasphaera jenkinsii Ben 74]
MTTAPLEPEFPTWVGPGYVLERGVPEGAEITEVSPESEAAVEAWLDDG